MHAKRCRHATDSECIGLGKANTDMGLSRRVHGTEADGAPVEIAIAVTKRRRIGKCLACSWRPYSGSYETVSERFAFAFFFKCRESVAVPDIYAATNQRLFTRCEADRTSRHRE